MRLFSFDYPPRHGGISRLCGEVALTFQRRRALEGVLTQAWESPTPAPYPSGMNLTPNRPAREAQALIHLCRSTSGVLAGIWYPEGFVAWLARARPLVILAHGLELRPTRSRWRRGLWKWLCRRILTAADLVVANSSYTAGVVRQVAPESRVVAVPLAVDHKRFSPGDRTAARRRFKVEGKRVVSTVARVQGYKGHDAVLKAVAALPSGERRDLVYLIAGIGPHIPALKALANELGVAEHVRWLGFVPEDHLADLYRASDLFVLCTRDEPDTPDVEGFGLVFLEAQACGTPVIGARTGGIPDAVEHGRGGWLIEQDDVPALTEHLQRLVAEPAVYETAGHDARARVEADWTWEHYTHRLMTALSDAGIAL